MFGPSGGWGIPIAPPTLMITVGGITTKPRYINGNLQPREMLDVTISVDHDLVDGAPAAPFARRLADLVKAQTVSDYIWRDLHWNAALVIKEPLCLLFVIAQSSRRRELGGYRPLSPRLYASKHPALRQQCAKEPERIRQWTERSRRRFTAVSVQQPGHAIHCWLQHQ
jgi:2-oxoacid dehydrogenases acyltransferase (catalytic domain)